MNDKIKKAVFTAILLLLSGGFTVMGQGMVVSDPASVTQRMALFLETMNESLEQTFQMVEQVETAKESLRLTQEAAEKLRKISSFIKNSYDVLQMSESGLRISKKIISYKSKIMDLSNLSDKEKYWILDMSVDIAAKAAQRVADGMKLAKEGATDGEFSDYERLQLIRAVKEEILEMERDIDDLYDRAASYNNYSNLIGSFRNYAINVATFSN